jgi:hypothetical protein
LAQENIPIATTLEGPGIQGWPRRGEEWSHAIGPSEPMQNDQTCFFSNIFLKFYNIIKNNLKL